MPHIAIPLPPGKGKQDIEIEITINGQKQELHYRVELFYWSDCELPSVNRVECIRHLLHSYDDNWQVFLIGDPNEEFVPVTFVKKKEWDAQMRPLRAA